MIVISGLSSYSTSIDGVACEGELSTAEKHEEAWCLEKAREVENKAADFALHSVRVELEVEDCALIVRCYGRPISSGVGLVGVLCTDGDEKRGRDAAFGELA